MGGGKSSSSTSGTIRYAPYLEAAHSNIIDHKGDDGPTVSMFELYNIALDRSPYTGYTRLAVDSAFFGTGYTMTDFPTLYDMFGKFMAGLDACDLWGEIYENVVHGPEIAAAVAAHSAQVQLEIDSTILPKFVAGMRDINSVVGSAFVIGKALIAEGHRKEVAKFDADIRLHAVDASAKLWMGHLEWNKSVVQEYAKLMQLYYDVKREIDKTYYEYAVKHELWNLNLLDYCRSIIGALNGAAAAKSEKEPSFLQKLLGGIMGGVSAGGAFGGIGSLFGGLLGAGSAFF